ncbi:MAG: 1,4-dihydroxy-6-naphthoate synthase [Desulfovibrionaceae bacterium]|nr:1,4-dihydroxy-6-naphthoate synthase [Desulfovibrionaceae bacterium]
MPEYTLALSPCPNDTYIFHALLHGLVPFDGTLTAHMADVEALNKAACLGKYAFSKISIGAYPACSQYYRFLSAGGALGYKCGPLVVGRKESARDGEIAIPGKMTSAAMLLDLCGLFPGKRREMRFSDIIPAVAQGRVDLGVIIHEGRFTYEEKGLSKVLDLGEWWEETYHVPVPLGAIVVRRDIPESVALAMERAIEASIAYAAKHPCAARTFIKDHAQELSDTVIDRHIATFVTAYSSDLKKDGQEAIVRMLSKRMADTGDVFVRPL